MSKKLIAPLLLGALLGSSACVSDPAEFRPAHHGGHEYPAAKDAYRVKSAPDDCEEIGVVHGRSIDAIAETAANHGGTHYVVRDDDVDESLETTTTATSWGRTTTGRSSTRVKRTHRMWAEVFRCR